jgi:hypothetical protein
MVNQPNPAHPSECLDGARTETSRTKRVQVTQARKSGETAIRGTKQQTVLDGKGRKVGVRQKISDQGPIPE